MKKLLQIILTGASYLRLWFFKQQSAMSLPLAISPDSNPTITIVDSKPDDTTPMNCGDAVIKS